VPTPHRVQSANTFRADFENVNDVPVKMMSIRTTRHDEHDFTFRGMQPVESFHLPPHLLAARPHMGVVSAFEDAVETARPGVPSWVHQTVKDGACFFRSLSLAMLHHQNAHRQIRSDIVEFIRRNEESYRTFLEPLGYPSIDDYVVDMNKETTWAGEQEVGAAAHVFNINVWVFNVATTAWSVYTPEHPGSNGDVYVVYNQCHYYLATDVHHTPLPTTVK
jgi:hypothetical protein